MKKIIIYLSIILFISGCANKTLNPDSMFAPRPFKMGSPHPNASAEYKQGWEDGCNTGLSTMNHGMYKSYYKYTQNASMVNDPVYYKAWKDSYTYCRHYSFRFVWDSVDKTGNKSLDNKLCILCPNQYR